MAYSGWSSRALCLLASLALAFAVGAPAGAQAVREAPVNPDFQRDATRALVGGAPGYRPSPVDWSHLRGGGRAARAVLPAVYDLRAQGRVTATRNQASSGSCWAFAAYASLESCLMPGETADFSENHLKNTHGFDPHPNTGGGNRDMATAYLARWSGPVNEADDPYNPSSTTSPSLPARKHMQHVIYLPDRTGPTDNDAIKQAVMTYGAVMTLYYANNTYFKPETNAYYNPYTTSVNHAVAIVGWDDHYSASNFSITPPGDGAFIVKNSWGPEWGQGGYFYMSYYEPTVRQNTVYYNAESVSNYIRCYQYDAFGLCSSMGYSSNTGWLANVFTAAGSELISAVSTYAQRPGTTYQLSIYVNPTNGPIGGTPAATQSGTFTDAGYHTVVLTSPVQVEAGERFSVVMRLTTPGYNYPIPVERPFTGYSSAAVASSGQSYISASGTSWTDLTKTTANANVCLKAFAQPGSAGSALTAVSLAATPASPQAAGTPVTLVATPTGGMSVLYKFEAGLNGGWMTLRNYSSGNSTTWTPDAPGSYSMKVSAYDAADPETVVTRTLAYTVLAPLTAVTLDASLPSPQGLGRTIRLAATATGGAAAQYRFLASSNAGASWTVLRDYGTAAFVDWTPAVTGDYLLKVAAREGASGAPVESAPIAFTVAPAPPTAVTLTASPASPQYIGTVVTLAAARTGGAASVQYQFEVSANWGASWTVLRAYGTASTLSWTPQAAGAYLLKVTAREPLLPAQAVSGTLAFSVVEPLSAVALAPSPASPQPIKTQIRLNAAPTGGINVQYQYYLSTNGGVSWSVLQKWTTAAYKDWKPTSNRDYLLKVEAREGATGMPVASEVLHYTITPAPPTSVKLTASPASLRTVSTPITLKAAKTGGKYVEYRFEASTDWGATWTVLRDFNALATAEWTPTTAATYLLRVSARESALPGVVVTATAPFIIAEPLTGVSLSTAHASLQVKDTRVQLSAQPVGGANVQYQYLLSRDNGLTWSVLSKWSKAASLNWKASATGNFLVKVSAREDARGVPFTSSALSFTIVPKPPTAVSLSVSKRSPQLAETPVQLKAKKKGGSVVQYQFEVSADQGAAWTVLQPFSSASTCAWRPATPAQYRLRVTAREATYPIAPVTDTLDYAIVPPLTAVALTTPAAAQRTINQPILIEAVATGGVNVKYQFSLSSNGGATWSVIQSWTSKTTKSWKPTRAGVYLLKVAARDGSGAPVESAAVPFTISAMAENAAVAWKVNLIARTGLESALVSLGESEITPTVVEAEETGGAISVFLEQPGQPALAADFRARSAGRQQWQFVVRRDPEAANFTDIVLTWPEVGKAPRELSFTLVDLTTGERRSMRTVTHYVIPASRGVGEHRFQVIASREPMAPLQIVGLTPAETTRATGTRVSYTLTRPAQVTLTVRALSGRIIYRMVAPQAQTAGLNTLLWDGHSAAGVRAPAGAYQVELLAQDNEGFRVRAVTLVNLR